MPLVAIASRAPRYRVTNWPAYEAGLRRRGDLTLWLDEAAVAGWSAPKRSTPGGQPIYSDLAIELVLTLRLAFHLALRQAEAFARSMLRLLGLDLSVPDHSAYVDGLGAAISFRLLPPFRSLSGKRGLHTWGGSGQVRPYVRPVARQGRWPSWVCACVPGTNLSRALEAQRGVRYCLDCFARQPFPSRGATLPAGSAGLAPGIHCPARNHHAAACAVAG